MLDASAIIALLWVEPGNDVIAAHLADTGGVTSAVNLAEVEAKLIDRGFGPDAVSDAVAQLPIFVAPFTADMARLSSRMREGTRELGLSLADRACLATARSLGSPALTTDHAWRAIDVGVEVILAR